MARGSSLNGRDLDALRTWAAEAGRLRALLAAQVGDGQPDESTTTLLRALDVARLLGGSGSPGVEVVDSQTLADLRADAEVGHNRRNRDLVNWAISTGRITPAGRTTWLTNLERTPAETEAELRGLRANTIPVRAKGHTNEPDDLDAELYRDVFGT